MELNGLNLRLNFGRVLITLYRSKWNFDRMGNFCDFIKNCYVDLNLGLWIFLIGKFGNVVGVVWFERICSDTDLYGFNSRIDLNDINLFNNIRLKYFWAETGSGKVFIEHLRDQLKPHHDCIIYSRIKNGKRIVKMLTRNDATTFMRSSKAPEVEVNTSFLQTAAARDFYLPTYNTQMAFAQCVGEMALLMAHAPVAAARPVKPVLERIQTCARLKQHRFYTSTDGTNAGLLTWAWITTSRLLVDSFDTDALQPFEWSEGTHLAVVDIVMSAESEALVWADIAGQLYPDEDIWVLCQTEERTYFKKWSKDQRSELLTHTKARSGIAFGTWQNISMEPSCTQ